MSECGNKRQHNKNTGGIDFFFFLFLIFIYFSFFASSLSLSVFGTGVPVYIILLLFLFLSYAVICLARGSFLSNLKDNALMAILFFFLLVLMAASLPIKGSLGYEAKSFFQVIRGIGYVFLVQLFVLNRRRVLAFLRTWFFAFLSILLISLANVWLGLYLPGSRFDPSVYSGNKVLPTGVFYNPNELALFIIITLPLFFSYAHGFSFLGKRLLVFIVTLTSVWVVFLAGSRLGILSLAFVVFLYIALMLVRGGRYEYITKLTLVFFVFAAVFFLPFIVMFIDSIGAGKSVASVLGVRYDLIIAALDIARDSYFLGVGVGNAEQYVSDLPSSVYDGSIINLHNMVMEVFVELGVIGLFVYFLIYFVPLIRLVKSSENGRQDKAILDGAFISLLAFLIMSPSGSSVIGMGVTWILLAYSINLPSALQKFK